jgi:hypothetical protein
MKVALVLPVLLASAWLAQAGSDDADKAVADYRKAIRDLTATLKTVKDKASAEAAVAKVEESAKRLSGAIETAKKISPADFQAAAKKLEADLAADSKAFAAELARVMKEPELNGGLAKSAAWKQLTAQESEARVQRAKVDVVSLEKAALAYKLANGNFPESLQALTQGKAYVEPGLLNDPWGRPYQFEPNTVNAKTGAPLIYSTGPDPKDKKGFIRNWNP